MSAPQRMPLRSDGQLRKRWRYVGVFSEGVMLCAARAQVGPLTQSFWLLWERGDRRRHAHTVIRPGSREVRLDGPAVAISARDVRAELTLGDATAIEARCPSAGGKGWGWTRKRAGVPVAGSVSVGPRRYSVEGLAVDDESAGFHARRTEWRWSAGVGSSDDGRPLAWNLVEGINDPPHGSERAIWVDGAPHEPAPVAFAGTEAVAFADGGRLRFEPACELARDDNYLLVRSTYRHLFGEFGGSLDGIGLASGMGVMETHSALW